MRWIRSWTTFDWFWIAWTGAGVAVELRAVRDEYPGGTLSDAIWWITGRGRQRTRLTHATRIVAICLAAVGVVHLFTRDV